MILRSFCAVVVGGLATVAAVASSVPLDLPGSVPAGEVAERRSVVSWNIEAAKSALAQGFPGLAARFFELALATDPAEPEREAILLPFASALLALGDFARAAEILEGFPDKAVPAWQLRQAYVAYHTGDPAEAAALLEALDSGELEPYDRAWYYLLRAFQLSAAGDVTSASAQFERASELAATPILGAQFEVLRIRSEMEQGIQREERVSELRATERSMRGQRGGFEAARLLAIALFREDRATEAVEVLDRQLRSPGLAETGLRPSFLLLLGLIAGEDTGRGRLALRQLVLSDARQEQRETGLYLLARGPLAEGGRPEFNDFLTDLLENHPDLPLRDQVLYLRALRRAMAGLHEGAEADALRLLEEIPGSPLIDHAYRLLAYLNWSRQPPRYRTAADFLNRLRAGMAAGLERARLGVLMGDCYFKNRDYAAASDVYAEVFRELPEAERTGLILPWVMADIRASRLDRAQATLDEAGASVELDTSVRWMAEWNLVDALRRAQRSDEALARLQGLFGPDLSNVDPELRIRFRWLEARLALDAGQASRAVELAESLLALLATGAESEVSAREDSGAGLTVGEPKPETVASYVLLLQGEALIASGDPERGNRVFTDLRERYPASGSAILSFLISARDLGAGDSLSAAQQTLRRLADEFRGSEYAPIALWETSIYAERRGTNSALRDAVITLEDLIQRYPGHPLAFFARLKQADISRKLNDFGSALMLYERMLQAYPDHPERYRIEMSRADSLLARGSVEAASVEDASLVYERIVDLPAIPDDARIEAGVKLAVAQQLLGRRESAEETLWLVRTRFDPAIRGEVHLERQGRYWLARALLELAAYAEAGGNLGGARSLYLAIVDGELPGQALARARLERFD